MQTFFCDGNEHVSGNGDPYLRLDGVLAGAVKNFDAQMLFDPFEEQLDLPALLVKCSNYLWLECEIVGQKRDAFSCLVFDHDATQGRWIVLFRVKHRQHICLIAHDVGSGPIDRVRITALKFGIAFGSRHKESAALVQCMQSLKVEIAAIHQVKSTALDDKLVERIDLVSFAVGDVDEAGNGTSQIEQRVQLDCRLGATKRRPRMDRQAKIDGGGIEGIHRCIQVHAQRFVGIQRARHRNQMLREVGVDLPRSCGVRIGQGIARDSSAAKSHVIEPMRLRSQIDFDVAQRFAIGQLRKRHGEELIQTRKIFDLVFAAMGCNATAKSAQRHEDHELRKNEFALMHRRLWRITAKVAKFAPQRSNRDQTKTSIDA